MKTKYLSRMDKANFARWFKDNFMELVARFSEGNARLVKDFERAGALAECIPMEILQLEGLSMITEAFNKELAKQQKLVAKLTKAKKVK